MAGLGSGSSLDYGLGCQRKEKLAKSTAADLDSSAAVKLTGVTTPSLSGQKKLPREAQQLGEAKEVCST